MAFEEDDDDIFRSLTENLDLDVETMTGTEVASLSNHQLITAFHECRDELFERGENLYPKTEIGKDLQTRYHGYRLEMIKRGLQ